jgi:dTDP-4-amino-4,6-dideoxygalactose transaminase
MSGWKLLVADLKLSEEDVRAAEARLRAGQLGPGETTTAFEQAVAHYTGAPSAVAVSSGTAALHLACLALGLGPGDEVIVPAFTFLATAAVARYTGASVVLCDSQSALSPNIDPADVERRITPRTRAVLPVHMWGYPADVLALRALCDAHGLVMIEDVAQGIGARVDAGGRRHAGTVGEIGCLSFFAMKQLSVGEGGMLLTADPALERRARLLSRGGVVRTDDGEGIADVLVAGPEYEFDDPRAAIGLSRLERLEADIAHRRAAVRHYRAALDGIGGLELMYPGDDERATHFAFGVLFETPELREAVRTQLTEAGIQTTRYPALHGLSEYAGHADWGSLPNAEGAAERHLVLPLSSHIAEDEVALVCATVRDAMARRPARAVA